MDLRNADRAGDASSQTGKRPKTLKMMLREILNQNKTAAARLNKIVSLETQKIREETIFLGFLQLRKIGYHVHDPRNFKPKHMKALGHYWEAQGLSPATIQNRISIFRVFCGWIGKGDMLGDSTEYVADPASVKRTYAAQRDKSWSGNSVAFDDVFHKVLAKDPRVAMYMLLAAAFGLRLRETYTIRPYLADRNNYLSVSDGTKGDRARTVPIENEDQRAAINAAKELTDGLSGHIGFPGKTLRQTRDRTSNVLRSCGVTKKDLGVTFHGLRHEFLLDFYERRSGVKAPVRGGPKISGHVDELARLQTSEVAGHTRKDITGAYIGPILRSIKKQVGGGKNELEE